MTNGFIVRWSAFRLLLSCRGLENVLPSVVSTLYPTFLWYRPQGRSWLGQGAGRENAMARTRSDFTASSHSVSSEEKDGTII
jgi:hypothetical protein